MDTQQQIVQSLFSHRGSDQQLDETYITHLKIWEDVPIGSNQPDEGGKKARYLMISVSKYGKVFMHKAKRNNNGSFSKGKTWGLEDLRQVEVVTPQTFALTMTSRTYIWQTERPRDQLNFLSTTCKVYRKYTQGRLPALLNLNFSLDDDNGSTQSAGPSPSPAHAQPQIQPGGMYPSAQHHPVSTGSSTSLAAPPPIGGRSRQNSGTSSIASSSAQTSGTGAGESFYTARGDAGRQGSGRPSQDSRRGEGGGSFSSQAGREVGMAEYGMGGGGGNGSGAYPGPSGPGQTAAYGVQQQYTPVPGMGPSRSGSASGSGIEAYGVSPLQQTGRLQMSEDPYSPAQQHRNHQPLQSPGGLAIPVPEPQRGNQNQNVSFGGYSPGGQGSYPTSPSGLVSPGVGPAGGLAGGMNGDRGGLGSRTVSEARTPTQATYGFREQAIPPPTKSSATGLGQGGGREQAYRDREETVVSTPTPASYPTSTVPAAEQDEYASESAMPTPVPLNASSGFDQQPMIPPVHPAAGSRSEEKKRAMLTPIVTGSTTTTSSAFPKNPARQRGSREAESAAKREEVRPIIPKPTVAVIPEPVKESSPPVSPVQTRARRASFVEPPTATPYSRDVLLRAGAGSFAQAEALLEQDDDDEEGMEDATMANVEEILEGFDWGSHHMVEHTGGSGDRQGAEAIEARLLDELNALEAANIHAFLETDDRIQNVLKGLDDAIAEMDEMDSRISGYKMQLGGVTEDIAFIESQNRGLQVQTANQQALLKELEQLLENVSVDPVALRSLTQESLETERGIQNLEAALSTLYKALLAIRDRDTNDMAAAAGRKDEYENHNRQFCLRLVEYLMIMIKFQAETAVAASASKAASGEIEPHAQMEQKLGMYCGLILYMIEMDEERYQKLCTNYFSTASELHSKEIKGLFISLSNKLKKAGDDDKDESSFTSAAAISAKSGAMQRSRTVMGNLRGADRKEKRSEGEMKGSEALDKALQAIAIQLGREEAFISDFLHITDSMLTYADYMDLDSYFRRQAVKYATKGMQPATQKLRRSALDLIFGFVSGEVKEWIDKALSRDRVQVFGMMAVLERAMQDAEDRNAIFYLTILQTQLQRLQGLVERYIADQVKAIENAQLSNRKRRGVVFFIKHFPVFVARVEAQLVDYDDFTARAVANAGYEKIVNTMLDTLQHMAKMDRSDVAGEDKGQLNHSIIMIENLHFYVQDAAKQDIAALHGFMERAKTMYDENMTAYIRAVLRKSFGRPWDFFEAVQKQLRSSSAQEISSSPSYNKSALKRAVKDISSGKEMRKAVEALVKRIEKHYSLDESDLAGTDDATAMSNEAAALIITVTQSCEKLLVVEVGKWSGLMAQCYAEAAASGVGLEYGPGDVEAAFKKARG